MICSQLIVSSAVISVQNAYKQLQDALIAQLLEHLDRI